MKRTVILIAASLILAVALAIPAVAADVAQGKCVTYDQKNKSVCIEEYDLNFSKEHPYGKPTGKQMVFSVANALVGIHPEPGDVLRIAYKDDGKSKNAVRVMNVSKQDLMKK